MRVKASLQFSCATTGRNLETQLITDTRNLVIFRRGTVAMRCAFCGLKHYWRLIKYHRQDIPDAGAIASLPCDRQRREQSRIQLGRLIGSAPYC